MDCERFNITPEWITMKVQYVTAGLGKGGPPMFGILKFKTKRRGWEVNVWPCDLEGNPVSDPIEWEDNLNWFDAMILFYQYYSSYNKYVNGN